MFCCATGREIFVGLSSRTNMLGAQSVGRAFPEYPTTIVHVNAPAIHLKDYIGMAGPEVMTVGKSEAAQKTFRVSFYAIQLRYMFFNRKKIICSFGIYAFVFSHVVPFFYEAFYVL